jgi:sec-independent protein translocase protein TatC
MAADDHNRELDRKEMPFLDHLEELRRVLLHSFLTIGVLAIGGWFLAERAIRLLIDPAGVLVFLSPTEAFTLRLKVAVVIGFLIALPFVLYKVWTFVAPGLFAKEKTILSFVVGGSTLLFFAGAFFGFAVLVPLAFRFLLGFRTENLQPMISAGNYFGFVIKLVIAFGIVFQLPLVISLLTWAGLVQPRWLLRNWRIALVIIAGCSALLTPPDVASQLLMALPVICLYFLSALLSHLIARRRKKEKEAGGEEEAS